MSASICRDVAFGEITPEDKKRAEFHNLVRDMREDIATHVELNRLLAKTTRAKFLALVDEGFTVEQALLLCK